MIQINLQKYKLKEFLKCLGWILLFIFLWFKGCGGNPKSETKVKITAPETKGSFEAKKPNHEPLVNLPINQLKNDGLTYIENPLNEKLLSENERLKNDFDCAVDSVQKSFFAKAIQINKFDAKFEDENIIINMSGLVRGEVQNVFPEYIWKEKTFEVPVKPKETILRVLGGLEIGNNTQLDNFNIKANLMFQNRKGNIFTGSIDTQETIWVGYVHSFLNITR